MYFGIRPLKLTLSALGPALALASVLAGCSSSPVQQVNVEPPQFKVIDAAPGGRETWLDNPEQYAMHPSDSTLGLDPRNFYYYSAEGRSASKRMACEKAQANALDDVAKRVATFVDTSLVRAATESNTSDTSQVTAESQVSEQTTRISSQLSKALLSNVAQKKRYWEQRDYSQVGGARSIYYCWILTEVSKNDILNMVHKAATLRSQGDPDLKAKVDAKLQTIDKDYDNYQKQH